MKKTNRIVGSLSLASLSFFAGALCAGTPGLSKDSAALRMPAAFQPNLGQAGQAFDYVAPTLGYSIGFSATRADLMLGGKQRFAEVGLRLAGANPNAAAVPSEPFQFKSGYRFGKTSIQDVPNYGKLRYSGVWPGIDVVYYATNGNLEYDFAVAPNADPAAIRLQFEGVTPRLSPQGDLLLETPSGLLIQKRPAVYQTAGSRRIPVEAAYRLAADGAVALSLGHYDRAKTLVIDPVLVFEVGQFLNAALDAYVATDPLGLNTYIACTSIFQALFPNTTAILFVTLDNLANITANQFVGATDGNSSATGIALDSSNNVYVSGYTNSPAGFPLKNAVQASSGGGYDAFLVKLSGDLRTFLYGTYLGGSGTELNARVAVNGGLAYVAGQTTSVNWPAASSPAGQNGFLYAIDTTQVGAASKIFALNIGGSGTDAATGVSVDGSGNLYVSGVTNSTDFAPTTTVGYQIAKVGSATDGFFLKFNNSGGVIWSTFYPNGAAAAVASYNNQFAYIAGQSTGAIPTVNAYQAGLGANHAFFAKFDTNATGSGSLVYATYLGGANFDVGTAIAVPQNGRAYVGGTTTSPNFPVFGTPVLNTFNTNQQFGFTNKNGFVAYVDPTLSGSASLIYSTFASTTFDTQINNIAAPLSGEAVIGATAVNTNGTPAGGFVWKVGSQIWNRTFFVTQLYLDLLDRQPDSGGLTYWVTQLTNGAVTRSSLAGQYFTSVEFSTGGLNIIQYYIGILGRDPDYTGWKSWFDTYVANEQSSLPGIENSFLNAVEFTNTYSGLTPSQYVTQVYQNVLGRAPDSAGLAYWSSQIPATGPNGTINLPAARTVMASFIASPEFGAHVRARAYADLLYMGFLRRNPDPSGLAFWQGQLANQANLPNVVNAFITSAEYVARFL